MSELPQIEDDLPRLRREGQLEAVAFATAALARDRERDPGL